MAEPRELGLALSRAELEHVIEALIAILDEADLDPDLEDNGDAELEPDTEQTLGWPNPALNVAGGLDQTNIPIQTWMDGECEPSLGWSDMEARYGGYGDTALTDLEEEHHGREPDPDDEYSLGWQNEGGQTYLMVGVRDLEQQCEDEGAEHDGAEVQSWPNPTAENRSGERS